MKNTLLLFVFTFFQTLSVFGQLGTIDPDFDPGTGFGESILESRVETIIQQPDGKLLVGGWFSEYNGTAISLIARLNLDGSLDNSFAIGDGFSGFSSYVKAIALQPDGKILVGGNFTEFDGTTRHRIARLNSDGSLDSGFDPLTGFNSDVNAIVVQPDGKILVAGIFSAYDWLNAGGVVRNRIARLNADGSLDTSFDPQDGFVSTTGGQTRIHKLILQPDGKILACGQFDEFNGEPRIIVARLNADGTLDNSFDAGDNFELIFGFYGESWGMKLRPDGKILLAGNFSHTGASGSGVVQLNSDGSLDTGFGINKNATAIGLQPDGKVYISETGPYNFNRLNTDGSSDAAFPQTTFNDIAQTIFVQTDGNIVIGGWFSYNPAGIMRLIGDNPSSSVSGVSANNVEVRVYPNPTSNQIHIDFKTEQFSTDLNFILNNAAGQEIKHLSIESNTSNIPLENVPSGVYFYRIQDKQAVIKSGKLVVH